MAYATLLSITQSLEQILHPNDQSLHLRESEQHMIRSLKEKASFLLLFLENDSLKYSESNLETRIRDVAYETEAMIESGFPHRNFEGSQKIVEEFNSILEEVVKMKERNQVEDLPQTKYFPPVSSSEPGSIDKSDIVGVREEMMKIKDRLTGSPSRREIISIVGMPGIGKTTLTKALYDDPSIGQRFDVRAWIMVSNEYNLQQMLTGLLDSIQNINHGPYPTDLAHHLYKTLKQRRYLIVMDDMWDIKAWEQVQRFFPDDNNGSRVIFTTRLQKVADDVKCPDSIYRPSLLSGDDSWKLLYQKAFKGVPCPLEFEGVGKDIAENCKGLPLSLAVIGGILYKADRTLDYWRDIAKNVNSALNNTNDAQVMNILSLSYKHLPHYLRACFLYMGVLPKDHKVSKSKLILFWVAEGFIKPAPTKSLEEVAHDYLESLIDRNMILVHERNCAGRIKKCGIHDLLRDLCKMIAKEENFLKVVNSHQSRVLNAQGNPFSNLQDATMDLVGLRYISFDNRERYELPSLISKFSNLQTLVITQGIVVLPLEIWMMPQIRHIKTPECVLPYPFDENVENFVSLENLQTLKGLTNFGFTEDAIRMMPNLRKLGIIFNLDSGTTSSTTIKIKLYLALLHQLEALSVFVGDNSDKKYRYPLPENFSFPPALRKLSLNGFRLSPKHMATIGSLEHLEELNLKRISFHGSMWEPTEGEFLGLKSLYLSDTNLKYLRADETNFPSLQCLHIFHCSRLKKIPLEIGYIQPLRLIHFGECKKSVEVSVKLIKEEQRDSGNDGLQIINSGTSHISRVTVCLLLICVACCWPCVEKAINSIL